MKAVVFLGEGQVEIRDYPRPTPGPDEVILRMKASGMCGSDLHHLRGPKRTEAEIVIEGHEPCGVVEEVGCAVAPREAKVGDRVMVHHYDGCRTCNYCRSGWTQFCPTERIVYGGLDGNGGHAEFMKVPAHTLVRLPDELSFKTGAAIACGTGTAYGAIRRMDLRADDTVAIFGQGPVGLSCTFFAKAFGARVIALDVGEERLAMARKFGADYLINPAQEDPVAALRKLSWDGDGVDKTLDCSGNITARRQAVDSLRRWGTACMVGVNGEMQFEANGIVLQHKTVIGSATFSKSIMADCAQFVAERGLDVESLFTHEFSIDQAAEAYALFDQQKMGKGVFLFD